MSKKVCLGGGELFVLGRNSCDDDWWVLFQYTKKQTNKEIPSFGIWKLTHYWYQFLQCVPGLHLKPPGLVGFLGAIEVHFRRFIAFFNTRCIILTFCHLLSCKNSVWLTIWQEDSYLHMKFHFCAEQLGVQTHQLSISVMEVALNTTGVRQGRTEHKYPLSWS